jgi:hypothetical protein
MTERGTEFDHYLRMADHLKIDRDKAVEILDHELSLSRRSMTSEQYAYVRALHEIIKIAAQTSSD